VVTTIIVLVVLFMPSICDYTWSNELNTIIIEEAAAAEVPLDLAYTFIAAESGFDPNAHALTPYEDSVGLLQLNRMGGQGEGYTVQQLKDPRFNLQVGLPYIHNAYVATWSPTIDPYEFIWLLSVRSGHPGDVPRDDYRILRIATIWSCFFPAAGTFGPGGAPSTLSGPGPALALAGGMPAILLFTLFPGGILRALMPTLNPYYALRGAAMATTPGGIVHNMQRALDPIEMMPHRRLMRLFRPRARLPRRHRPPRR